MSEDPCVLAGEDDRDPAIGLIIADIRDHLLRDRRRIKGVTAHSSVMAEEVCQRSVDKEAGALKEVYIVTPLSEGPTDKPIERFCE